MTVAIDRLVHGANAFVGNSSIHVCAAAESIASRLVDVDTPGRSAPHLARLRFERWERRIFPLDEFEWSP